jgi:hypothetical protein
MRVAPDALVGRHLRVYWDNDDAWFAGSVVEWDAGTGRHKVRGLVQTRKLEGRGGQEVAGLPVAVLP